MNFLAHDVVLPNDSHELTRVGATLPDLWALHEDRPLPMAVLRRLQAETEQDARWVAAGIQHHMRADAVFHRHNGFVERVQRILPDAISLWPGLRHAQIACHVLVEMMLDRWLLDTKRIVLSDYYRPFSPNNLATASRYGVADPAHVQGLRAILDRFRSSEFLDAYRTPEGLLDRFVRSMGRTPFGGALTIHPRACECVDEWSGSLGDGWESLLEDVRTAVIAWPR